MKKQIFNLFTIVTLGIAVVSCNKTKEAQTTNSETALVSEESSQKYRVNSAESVIEWKGFKPTGSHNGTINLENGTLTTNNGKINSGTFLINMSSIKESENNARLEGHLKSPDFFDVEKFPTGAFEITGIKESMLSGNLTIKGITNNVSFSVSISDEGGDLLLTSDAFTINRSKWDIRYKSKSFFNDLGDKFIDDDIEIKITIKANKA